MRLATLLSSIATSRVLHDPKETEGPAAALAMEACTEAHGLLLSASAAIKAGLRCTLDDVAVGFGGGAFSPAAHVRCWRLAD